MRPGVRDGENYKKGVLYYCRRWGCFSALQFGPCSGSFFWGCNEYFCVAFDAIL